MQEDNTRVVITMTTKAIIDTGKWEPTPDDELGVQGYHIDSIEYDERNKNWFISSTFTEGKTYGYRVTRNGNTFTIVESGYNTDTTE